MATEPQRTVAGVQTRLAYHVGGMGGPSCPRRSVRSPEAEEEHRHHHEIQERRGEQTPQMG